MAQDEVRGAAIKLSELVEAFEFVSVSEFEKHHAYICHTTLAPEPREIFSRKGAYGKFKRLLDANEILDRWYVFEERATEAALRVGRGPASGRADRLRSWWRACGHSPSPTGPAWLRGRPRPPKAGGRPGWCSRRASRSS